MLIQRTIGGFVITFIVATTEDFGVAVGGTKVQASSHSTMVGLLIDVTTAVS